MKYTEEIYSTLSHGGFISSNSLSPAVRRYYDAIEEELTDYYEYYKGIGFYLESGNGYYFFARKESKADIDRKLEAAAHLDRLSLLLENLQFSLRPRFRIQQVGHSDTNTYRNRAEGASQGTL